MNKNFAFILVAAAFIVFAEIAGVSAVCQVSPQLVSQDPYPAVPGDSVKLVFQVNGLGSTDCGNIRFELVPSYPILFNPSSSPYFTVQGGTYSGVNYGTYATIPYTVNIDPNAINGNDTIDFRYALNYLPNVSRNYIDNYFNLSVQDVRSTFEVFVKNYDFTTKDLTLEILNTGTNNVEALTIEIPPQNNVTVKGSNYNVVGSLSSEDYSTADFTVLPYNGNINLTIYYNDITGTRRNVSESVYFNPDAFAPEQQPTSPLAYIVIVVIVLLIAYWIYRRRKKNKKKKLLRE